MRVILGDCKMQLRRNHVMFDTLRLNDSVSSSEWLKALVYVRSLLFTMGFCLFKNGRAELVRNKKQVSNT